MESNSKSAGLLESAGNQNHLRETSAGTRHLRGQVIYFPGPGYLFPLLRGQDRFLISRQRFGRKQPIRRTSTRLRKPEI